MPIADDLLGALRRGSLLRVSFALAGRREMFSVGVLPAQFAEASAEFLTAEREHPP